jgi:hypothetical protein
LIISFLSFAQSVIDNVTGSNSRPFQFGMFFHIISIGFHLFAAIVAARAGMICFRISKSLDLYLTTVVTPDSQTIEEYPNVPTGIHSSHDGRLHTSDFHGFLVLCEQLQMIGTVLYFPSAMFLIFYMFERIEFAIVIYALTGIGGLAVYRLGFWKVSVLWHDLNHGYSKCKKMVLGIGKSK